MYDISIPNKSHSSSVRRSVAMLDLNFLGGWVAMIKLHFCTSKSASTIFSGSITSRGFPTRAVVVTKNLLPTMNPGRAFPSGKASSNRFRIIALITSRRPNRTSIMGYVETFHQTPYNYGGVQDFLLPVKSHVSLRQMDYQPGPAHHL